MKTMFQYLDELNPPKTHDEVKLPTQELSISQGLTAMQKGTHPFSKTEEYDWLYTALTSLHSRR